MTEEIKWSYGEEYKKSKKEDKPILNDKNEIIQNVLYRGEQVHKKKFLEEIKNSQNNKTDIFERSMTIQTCINPFLKKKYEDVLIDQEKFLIPQNSLFL